MLERGILRIELTGDNAETWSPQVQGFLQTRIYHALERVSSKLFVVVTSEWLSMQFDDGLRSSSWPHVEFLLKTIYTNTARFSYNLRRDNAENPMLPETIVLLECMHKLRGDVLFSDLRQSLDCREMSDGSLNSSSCFKEPFHDFVTEPGRMRRSESKYIEAPPSQDQKESFSGVVLGGAFDHLHAGHKILLTMAAFLCTDRLTCGVSDEPLLKSKKFPEEMESLTVRIESVRQFLLIVSQCGITVKILPLSDSFGPTLSDSSFDVLVVSLETLNGAHAINARRQENGMEPLTIFIINVVSSAAGDGSGSPESSESDEIKFKLSSTFIRAWLHYKSAP